MKNFEKEISLLDLYNLLESNLIKEVDIQLEYIDDTVTNISLDGMVDLGHGFLRHGELCFLCISTKENKGNDTIKIIGSKDVYIATEKGYVKIAFEDVITL